MRKCIQKWNDEAIKSKIRFFWCQSGCCRFNFRTYNFVLSSKMKRQSNICQPHFSSVNLGAADIRLIIHTRYIYFWSRDIHTEIYTNYCKESTSIRNWIIWSLLMTKLTDNPHLWIAIDQSSSDTLFTSSLHYHLPLLVSSSSQ